MAAGKATKATAPKKTKKAPKTTDKAFATTKFKDYTIAAKRSGRFVVFTTKTGKNVNGVEKAKILVEAKLVQASFTKKEEAAAPTA